MSGLVPREFFLIAKDVGYVGETWRFPNAVSLFAIYYRIQGVGTAGSVAGTIFANAANQVFFVP